MKAYEKRIDREIEEKEGLLQDIERVSDLKIHPLIHHKEILVDAKDLSLGYPEKELFSELTFQVKRGEKIVLTGENGCGKSSIIKAILDRVGYAPDTDLIVSGKLEIASGIVVSYVNQDTSFLSGSSRSFCEKRGLDVSLFFTVLRHLDFGREQFEKKMEDYSEGQKKKVLIAASLITPAHLYIWDEPLNYIDVFSRMQIEKLIKEYELSMLLVEHDSRFRETVATRVVNV